MNIQKIASNIDPKRVSKIIKNVNSNMPKSVRYLSGYQKRMSEAQDILINAIGTGVVAPIVINYNPVSKEDKKSKTYSALRQTAMAITAVVVQAGVTIPFEKYLDKTIKSGDLGEKFLDPKNAKALKRVSSLALAIFTIPLSCALMNKFYPKFMDKFFPNISKKEVKNEDK